MGGAESISLVDPLDVSDKAVQLAERKGVHEAEVLVYSIEHAVARFSRSKID